MLHASIIPSHSIALWLLHSIDNVLDFIGLRRYQTVEQVIYFAIIVVVSFFIGWCVRWCILAASKKIVELKNTSFSRALIQDRTLSKCSHIITPLVFLALVPFAFESSAQIHTIIVRVALIYLIFTIGYAITSVMAFVFKRIDEKENTKGLPLKGILNLALGIIWGLVLIISISVLVQKSPIALLGGLTAFAAVLMLVFKDTILGFVAGIQMSQNDMVRVGDWIVVPSTPANGIVEDVSLTTVKVRNFDNTYVTVPPYTLVSSSFQNWRGMSESGIRRINENIYINPCTITVPTPDMVNTLCAKYPGLKAFVDKVKADGVTVSRYPGSDPVNGSLETNLGLFRAYLNSYLVESDMIDHNGNDLMVCITQPTHEGVPVNIYCFAVTTQWEAYVAILSGVVEHAIMAAADFGLEILSADHLAVTTK